MKKRKIDSLHSQGQLLGGASTQSQKIQALVTESIIIRPKPSCKPKKTLKEKTNFSHS
jgi:hypothetical protein